MLRKMGALLGLSALCLGLAALPANAAGTSRIFNFAFLCDGTNKTVTLTVGVGASPPLPASVTVFAYATELVAFENQGGLQYVLAALGTVPGSGDRTKQLANMGLPPSAGAGVGDHIRNEDLVGIPIAVNAAGQVLIQIDGACSPAFPGARFQGTITVWFTGPGIP